MIRFWSKVDRRGPDECWPWRATKIPSGYGSFCYKGKSNKAHRVAFELTYGVILPGQHVLHSCHNRDCCNPAHLRAGTHQENMAEKKSAGRSADNRGLKNPKCKLSEAMVKEIRLYDQDASHASLGRKYGVTPELISMIRRRLIWTHLEG